MQGKENRFLIGPNAYDIFTLVTKLFIGTTLSILGLIFIIQMITNPLHTLEHFVDLIVYLMTGFPITLGWVVIGCITVQYFNKDFAEKFTSHDNWDPVDLPPVPTEQLRIK